MLKLGHVCVVLLLKTKIIVRKNILGLRYEITKSKFAECDDNRQAELMQFFTEQLMDSIEGIEKSLKQIDSQQYILNINGIYDEGLRKILGDYSFEFYAAKLTLGREYDKADFWKSFDAIKQDLINYIYNWVDIRYYNYCRFKPYKFHDDKSETMRASWKVKINNAVKWDQIATPFSLNNAHPHSSLNPLN